MNMSWILAVVVIGGLDDSAPAKPKTPEVWSLTLRDAIRISLANHEVARLVPEGKAETGFTVLVPKTSDRVGSKLTSELLAHVRSVEQQYWTVWLYHVRLQAREKAVKLCEEIVQHERDKPGLHRSTDLSKAFQCLQTCKIEQIKDKADGLRVEGQLRNLLGLRDADCREINPVTAPIVAKIEPDWATSVSLMRGMQPDIVSQGEMLIRAEQCEESLRSFMCLMQAPLNDAFSEILTPALVQAHETTDRQRAILKQVVHQSTHSLARFFLEVDSNYKQYEATHRLCQTARDRLESSKASYEEGKPGFPIDRLLDAVTQLVDAESQSAQCTAGYNIALASLSEAQGMLLNDRHVIVNTDVRPIDHRPAEPIHGESAYKLGLLQTDGAVRRASVDSTPAPQPVVDPAKSVTTSITYQVTVDGGTKVIKFEGAITTTTKP